MAHKITDACVSCGSCAENCPVEAISQGETQYVINAAVHAGISVDHVLGIALGDSLNGAVLGAGAAADAGVGNFVSHSE